MQNRPTDASILWDAKTKSYRAWRDVENNIPSTKELIKEFPCKQGIKCICGGKSMVRRYIQFTKNSKFIMVETMCDGVEKHMMKTEKGREILARKQAQQKAFKNAGPGKVSQEIEEIQNQGEKS